MKKRIIFFALLLFGVGAAYAAGEFDGVDNVVKNLDSSVSTTSGSGMSLGSGDFIFHGFRHSF